eukprot:307460_1
MIPTETFHTNNINAKTISTLGSIFFFFNNTVGPGLVLFPALYQQSGWFSTSSSTILLCFMSYIIGIMLTLSIRKIPHNQKDDLKIEYVDLIKYYLGFNNNEYQSDLAVTIGNIVVRFCQFMYILFMLSFLMGSIIQTTQTFDLFIAKICGHSYGIIYFPFHQFGFVSGDSLDTIDPFNMPYSYVLSIGTIIIYLAFIPLSLKNLSEAIWIQYIGFYGTIILVFVWCIMLMFSAECNTENVPVMTASVYNLLPINFVNIAYISTYPSWLNEKQTNVSYKSVLKWTCGLTLLCYLIVGYVGGIAFSPYYNSSADLLSKLNNFKPNSKLTNVYVISFFEWFGPISGYLYPLVQSASGIPPFCAVIRYNLLNSGILQSGSNFWANILSVFIPFVVSIILYHGNGFNNLLNWTGVVFSSFINYILPILFYYKALKRPKHIWYQISKSQHHLDQLSKSDIDLKSIDYEECVILTYDETKQMKSVAEGSFAGHPEKPKHTNRTFFFFAIYNSYVFIGIHYGFIKFTLNIFILLYTISSYTMSYILHFNLCVLYF